MIAKNNSSIVMIKRIIKFIPKSEYMKIYDGLFKSHLSYCISSWGAIPISKLQGVFAIQKRCIRLLFGMEYSFDHAGYYETCARVRTYEDHMSKKNYCLEHTKPLFNKHNILSLPNLYVYHTFIELFKIQKTRVPISLFSLFELSNRDTSFLMHPPKVNLNISKNNYVFKSCIIWNKLIDNILEKSQPGENDIIVRGSAKNSDFCATIPFTKKKLKLALFKIQELGEKMNWVPENFLNNLNDM